MIVEPSGWVISMGYGVAGTAQRAIDSMLNKAENKTFFILIMPIFPNYTKMRAKVQKKMDISKKNILIYKKRPWYE
jgi:hypothetical protein